MSRVWYTLAMAMHTYLHSFLTVTKEHDNQSLLLWNRQYSLLLERRFERCEDEEEVLQYFKKHYLDVVRYMHMHPAAINRCILLLEQMVSTLFDQDMDIFTEEATSILMELPYYLGLKNCDTDGLTELSSKEVLVMVQQQMQWLAAPPNDITLPDYILSYAINFLIHLKEGELLTLEQQRMTSQTFGAMVMASSHMEERWLYEELTYWEDYGEPSYLSKVMPLAIVSPEQECDSKLQVWLDPLYETDKRVDQSWDYYCQKWHNRKKICFTDVSPMHEERLWL